MLPVFFFNLAFLLVHCIESDNSKREQWELAKKEVDFNGNIDCPLGVEWNNLTIQRWFDSICMCLNETLGQR